MNELETLMSSSTLESKTKELIEHQLVPFLEQAKQIGEECRSIVVTDALQTELMAEAKEKRLQLRNARTSADKVRKSLKADALAYGKVVQGVYNIIEGITKPIEQHLENQENFVKIQKKKIEDELDNLRRGEISKYNEFAPAFYLGSMSDDEWQKTLNGSKLQFEENKRVIEERNKKEREERDELDILRKERIELDKIRIEKEKIEKQNEELKKKIEENEIKSEPKDVNQDNLPIDLREKLNNILRQKKDTNCKIYNNACELIQKTINYIDKNI